VTKPHTPPSPDRSPNPKGTGRPYQKPRLTVYGDLAEITKGKIGSKANDGVGHPNRHFTS
jgi:hypothetical protein